MQPQSNQHNGGSDNFTEESEEQMQPGSNWHNVGSDYFNEETEAQMQPQSNWHNRGSDDLIEDSETQIQPQSNRAAGRALSQIGFGLTSQISSQLDPSNTGISASEIRSGQISSHLTNFVLHYYYWAGKYWLSINMQNYKEVKHSYYQAPANIQTKNHAVPIR